MRAYAFLGDALREYQGAVVDALRARGFAIDPLVKGELADLPGIASGPPALLFLCGLPYVRTRDAGLPVEALAAPVAVTAPEDPPAYLSLLVARPGLAGCALEDLRDARLAINGRDSMSGWVLPVGTGLPLERFAQITSTGGHVRSLEALLREEVDAAPIDSMLLAAEGRVRPELLDLPVLATYGPSPSPPIVFVGDDRALAARLREALGALATSADGAAALALGGMARLEPVGDGFYDATRDCDRRAALCTR